MKNQIIKVGRFFWYGFWYAEIALSFLGFLTTLPLENVKIQRDYSVEEKVNKGKENFLLLRVKVKQTALSQNKPSLDWICNEHVVCIG